MSSFKQRRKNELLLVLQIGAQRGSVTNNQVGNYQMEAGELTSIK